MFAANNHGPSNNTQPSYVMRMASRLNGLDSQQGHFTYFVMRLLQDDILRFKVPMAYILTQVKILQSILYIFHTLPDRQLGNPTTIFWLVENLKANGVRSIIFTPR